MSGNYLVGTAAPDGLALLNAAGTQVTILLNNVPNPVGTAAVTFGIGTTSLTAGAQGQSYGTVNLAGIGGSGSYVTWSATVACRLGHDSFSARMGILERHSVELR